MPPAAARQLGSESTPGTSAGFHAPLFEKIVTGHSEDVRRVVLDLGTASTELLALLARSPCRADIADLNFFGDVDRLNAAESLDECIEISERALPGSGAADELDVVFAWDLFNYLSRDALRGLMRVIGKRMRPGGVVHALVVYSEKTMTVTPGRYLPLSDSALVSAKPAQEFRDAPRYSPEDLLDALGGFEIHTARLLSNGMQEFLFRRPL